MGKLEGSISYAFIISSLKIYDGNILSSKKIMKMSWIWKGVWIKIHYLIHTHTHLILYWSKVIGEKVMQ